MFIVINIILNKKWQLPHFPQEGEDDSQIGGKRFVPKPDCMDYINFTLTSEESVNELKAIIIFNGKDDQMLLV